MRIRSKLLFGLTAIVILMVAVALAIIREQSVMRRSFAVHEHMTTLERLLLECRRQEKNFLLRHDESSPVLHAANLDSLIAYTENLRSEVADPEIVSKLSLLTDNAEEYGSLFRDLAADWLENSGRMGQEITPLEVSSARKCHALVADIQAGAVARFNAANATAHTVSIFSIIVGVVLSLLIAGLLTRNIVGPLETLRALAERVSTGDIQDMDVEFTDLEMRRFNSRETLDLARSLQRMVTSMRLLVSTERGLMDDYHMTIVVLVNKALGPNGWTVIERARNAARFEAFAEVNPSNVDAFLAELEKEAESLIPRERIDLLCNAIRALRT